MPENNSSTITDALNAISQKTEELLKSGRGGKDFQQMVSAIDCLKNVVNLQELRIRELESKFTLPERVTR